MTDTVPPPDKTSPMPMCEGSSTCDEPVEVLFVRTGVRMCLDHSGEHIQVLLREKRDTDRAPPESQTVPPPDEV